MKNTVWKFILSTAPLFILDMPEGAKVVSVEVVDESPCIYAIVDPNKPVVARYFAVHGTGHEMSEHCIPERFKGSFIIEGSVLGTIVFHVFDLGTMGE